MKQHKLCPDEQQYNNGKPIPFYIVASEEIENHYECSNMVHETGTRFIMFYNRV